MRALPGGAQLLLLRAGGSAEHVCRDGLQVDEYSTHRHVGLVSTLDAKLQPN